MSALLCPILVWPLVSPSGIAAIDLLKLFLFGTMQFGLGLILLTIGGQMISATENALINTLETPLAVAWIWVCFGEVPTIMSFAGGIIVMAAVAAHVWHSSRSNALATAALAQPALANPSPCALCRKWRTTGNGRSSIRRPGSVRVMEQRGDAPLGDRANADRSADGRGN
jgi:hypothetical protein